MRCRYSISIDRSRGRSPSSALTAACSATFSTLPLGKAAPLRRPDPGWIARPVAPRAPELPFISSFMLVSLLVYVHVSGLRWVSVKEDLACWHTICHMSLQVEHRPWPHQGRKGISARCFSPVLPRDRRWPPAATNAHLTHCSGYVLIWR